MFHMSSVYYMLKMTDNTEHTSEFRHKQSDVSGAYNSQEVVSSLKQEMYW